jgi:hypothetical protein
MSEIDNGGPAFAEAAFEHNSGGSLAWQEGISVRDYFAVKALQAIFLDGLRKRESLSDLAKVAYAAADNMINERGRR